MRKLTAADLLASYKKAREKRLKKEKLDYYEIQAYVKTQNGKYLRKHEFYR